MVPGSPTVLPLRSPVTMRPRLHLGRSITLEKSKGYMNSPEGKIVMNCRLMRDNQLLFNHQPLKHISSFVNSRWNKSRISAIRPHNVTVIDWIFFDPSISCSREYISMLNQWVIHPSEVKNYQIFLRIWHFLWLHIWEYSLSINHTLRISFRSTNFQLIPEKTHGQTKARVLMPFFCQLEDKNSPPWYIRIK